MFPPIWGVNSEKGSLAVADDAELVEALMLAATGHAGQGGEAPMDFWPAFLARLARAIQAESLTQALQPPDGPAQVWTHGSAPGLPDPRDVARMRVDRVYSRIDLPGAASDGPPLRALRCPVPGGGQMLLMAERAGADFRAIDAVRLSGLGRTMARALAAWLALRVERAHATRDHLALRALGIGWLLLNPSGRVLAAADGAEGLAFRAGLRLRADGWLDVADPDTAAGLQSALSTAQAAGRTVPVPTRDPAIRLAVQPAQHIGNPALILWLRAPKPLRDRPAETLAQGFQLSRSEARLAARIADGQSLAEAAADLGWTIETARSCSKTLYARLGVRGQTGVALALHTSPLWLAAGPD